ncbi:MAG: hypothetical protein E7326_04565 [Clostridiales bacterium]|nr:hypothetical protein [Clostridiales bacterium]
MDQKNEPVNATGHNWQAVAATAATCQSAKVVTYKCSKCNDTKTETEGSKTDHSWVQTYYEPATCAADGYKSYKCGMCSETKTDVLPATEQCSWGEWKVTKEATEVATGTKERTCKTCGAKDTETIPKKGAKPTATEKPTDAPTQKPTDKPTNAPTQKPTNKPTKKPTAKVSSSFEAEEGTVQVFTTAGKVNLRSGPGKDHKYVDQVPKKNTCLGQLLDAQLDKHNVVWFQVEYDGRQCWITSQYAVAVPGEYCGIIRIPDGDLTELSNIYLQSFDEIAITLGLNENMDSDMREFTNGSVFITGQHYIEHIVLTGAGYTVYGVKVGDNVTDAVRLLKQKLVPDSQSTEAYIYRIPCSPDSVSIDGEGFDGTLTITVDANKQVTSITVKAGVPEAE